MVKMRGFQLKAGILKEKMHVFLVECFEVFFFFCFVFFFFREMR